MKSRKTSLIAALIAVTFLASGCAVTPRGNIVVNPVAAAVVVTAAVVDTMVVGPRQVYVQPQPFYAQPSVVYVQPVSNGYYYH